MRCLDGRTVGGLPVLLSDGIQLEVRREDELMDLESESPTPLRGICCVSNSLT